MTASLIYLWSLRTLYVGKSFTISHEVDHAASVLVFALERDMEIYPKSDPGNVIKTRIALIPAGVYSRGDSKDQLFGCLFLDPIGRDLERLKSCMTEQRNGIWFNSSIQSQQIETMKKIIEQSPAPADAFRWICDEIFPPMTDELENFKSDERILKVIEWVKQNPASNVPNREYAERIGLSSSQMQRLFKETTGVPIRRYRLWHRLFVAAILISCGRSLTEAALEAGFSDSSHFTHTFRSMLGIKPSLVLNQRNEIQVFAGGDVNYK